MIDWKAFWKFTTGLIIFLLVNYAVMKYFGFMRPTAIIVVSIVIFLQFMVQLVFNLLYFGKKPVDWEKNSSEKGAIISGLNLAGWCSG